MVFQESYDYVMYRMFNRFFFFIKFKLLNSQASNNVPLQLEFVFTDYKLIPSPNKSVIISLACRLKFSKILYLKKIEIKRES